MNHTHIYDSSIYNRGSNRKGHELTEESQGMENGGASTATGTECLAIKDNLTGRSYDVEIEDGTVRSMDFRGIKADEEDFGLMTYDPGYSNTASVRSAITYIDGEKGILQHRGIPIEQLCEQSTYLEVAYLLIYGHLPTEDEYNRWVYDITHHTYVHENIKNLMDGFRHDANPMGMLLASVGGLSTFYPEAANIDDEYQRHVSAVRLIAKMPTLAAFSYRHSLGLPYVYPDHEQNCSAAAVRIVGSSRVDPFSAIAAGVAGLYGPLHGGANVAVLRMLQRIGNIENILDFLQGVKDGNERLMGFGHRVYKNYDPRARIIRSHVDEVLEATSKESPLLDIAIELEKRALDDEYFTSRKLYPNVDFYSGLIYEALGIPTDAFTVMFAIPRTSGWMAQWMEMLEDPELRIARPRQIYTGPRDVDYVPIDER